MENLNEWPAVAASSDGQWIATEQGNTLTIWNAKIDGKVVERKVQVCSLFASGSDDGVVIGPGMMAIVGSHTLGFAPNGDRTVGCDTRDVRIWNSYSGKLHQASTPTEATARTRTPSFSTPRLARYLENGNVADDSSTPSQCRPTPDSSRQAHARYDEEVRTWA
ncbi:hypothetical protein PAXINDRAFT_20520 [Paxillus involutus ATCC 200175]|uniref:Uncharacterized protein n=1 Tax=Paxillus involutus ATCC 200175 TaxID=664439 RepID=A0A0C9SMJ4_PAXIN|nr:hypothetical protein PAXINDRAFT_20520 [Paxillus involutus ATCC 200175]